jgi:hypothetical protein
LIRKSAIALAVAFTLVASAFGSAQAQKTPHSATGTWTLRYAGNPMSASQIVMHQQGQIVVGTYGAGYTLRGEINKDNPLQVDATWQDSTNNTNGWATLIFSSDWMTLSGKWGAPGRQPEGTFVGKRYFAQINTTGTWNVTLVGLESHDVILTFSQTGSSFIAKWPNGHITGTLPAGAKSVHGTWQTKTGSGPIDLTFNKDGTSFTGTWGYNGKAPSGRVQGTKQ